MLDRTADVRGRVVERQVRELVGEGPPAFRFNVEQLLDLHDRQRAGRDAAEAGIRPVVALVSLAPCVRQLWDIRRYCVDRKDANACPGGFQAPAEVAERLDGCRDDPRLELRQRAEIRDDAGPSVLPLRWRQPTEHVVGGALFSERQGGASSDHRGEVQRLLVLRSAEVLNGTVEVAFAQLGGPEQDVPACIAFVLAEKLPPEGPFFLDGFERQRHGPGGAARDETGAEELEVDSRSSIQLASARHLHSDRLAPVYRREHLLVQGAQLGELGVGGRDVGPKKGPPAPASPPGRRRYRGAPM